MDRLELCGIVVGSRNSGHFHGAIPETATQPVDLQSVWHDYLLLLWLRRAKAVLQNVEFEKLQVFSTHACMLLADGNMV